MRTPTPESGAADTLPPPGVRVAPAVAGVPGHGVRRCSADALLGEFLRHPIVVDNRYTRWFRTGAASREELRHFTVQFSVFSNQFLVAQLHKMIQAETLASMRASKEILANEIGVVLHANGATDRARPNRPGHGPEDGDVDWVVEQGSVDGGTFRFRAAHFEWLLQFAAGASVAIENWAAAGFWQELVDGLVEVRKTRLPDLALGFFTYHNRIESQHADHTRAELAGLQRHPDFDATVFVESGRRMLDALAVFWYGLEPVKRPEPEIRPGPGL